MADVDFDRLKNKVEDAGFFVAAFWATIHFDNLKVKPDEPVMASGKTLMFVHVADQELNGDKTLKFIDKGYLPVKEYKKNSALTTKECYKTGIAGSSYVGTGVVTGSRVYHVTI